MNESPQVSPVAPAEKREQEVGPEMDETLVHAYGVVAVDEPLTQFPQGIAGTHVWLYRRRSLGGDRESPSGRRDLALLTGSETRRMWVGWSASHASTTRCWSTRRRAPRSCPCACLRSMGPGVLGEPHFARPVTS